MNGVFTVVKQKLCFPLGFFFNHNRHLPPTSKTPKPKTERTKKIRQGLKRSLEGHRSPEELHLCKVNRRPSEGNSSPMQPVKGEIWKLSMSVLVTGFKKPDRNHFSQTLKVDIYNKKLHDIVYKTLLDTGGGS